MCPVLRGSERSDRVQESHHLRGEVGSHYCFPIIFSLEPMVKIPETLCNLIRRWRAGCSLCVRASRHRLQLRLYCISRTQCKEPFSVASSLWCLQIKMEVLPSPKQMVLLINSHVSTQIDHQNLILGIIHKGDEIHRNCNVSINLCLLKFGQISLNTGIIYCHVT
jgi:hypothetical protein